MPPPVLTTDRTTLERCLTECKRKLNRFREVGDDIQAALTEADMDQILDALHSIYTRKGTRQ